MAGKNYSFGLILIVIAVILLLGKLGVIGFVWGLFWPLLILAAALLLHFLFFWRVAPSSVIVPGGILLTYSLMFLYCNLFGWHTMNYLWPGFIFGIAVGLYEWTLFDRYVSKVVFTAAFALAIIAALFFVISLLFTVGIYLIVAILVVIGLLMLLLKTRVW